METFTSFQYLAIDIANNYGLDKLSFEERIEWTLNNINNLEKIGEKKHQEDLQSSNPAFPHINRWKEYPLYMKGVRELNKVRRGKPTGHMIHLDSTASGLQIMAALTNCYTSAEATNLIDPDTRVNTYKRAYEYMQGCSSQPLEDITTAEAKEAIMTSFYGSQAQPIKLFGEDTPALEAFYKMARELFSGPSELLNDLLNSWDQRAYEHSWVLPDNHHVHVKVQQAVSARIKVEELGNSSFTYKYLNNQPSEFGLANAANVVHSIDGYILRSLIRRCSYDVDLVESTISILEAELLARHLEIEPIQSTISEEINVLVERYNATKMIDITHISAISQQTVIHLTTEHIKSLIKLLIDISCYPPFDIITVHDSFACSPVHMNTLRYHYKEILADLADSAILDDILSSLYNEPVKFVKPAIGISSYIRNSNYAIC